MTNGHDLAMRLRSAYLSLHRRTNSELARFGMTADQFVLLTVLSEGDAVTQKELVERSGSDPNTMSERLGRLERLGLITRARQASDARARSVALTDEGRRVQGRLWVASVALRQVLEDLFPNKTLDTLVDHLDRIIGAMTATEVELPDGNRGRPARAGRRRSVSKSKGQ